MFASDEYNQFANTGYNDVFAFYLTPPGGSPTNIALVPGTTDPVSINNVNLENNPQYYIDNDISTAAHLNTEMNGLTTVLTATASIVPGETYHIKLAICDVGDPYYDSNVFIKAGSFTAPPTVTPPPNQSAVEGAPTNFNFGSFSDPSSGPFQVDVNWGDGTPDTTFSVPGDSADNVSLGTQPHTYSQAGTENPTVTVTNSAGLSDSATFQVNVSYVPPSLLPSVTTSVSSVPEGGVGNQSVTYTYTVTNTSQASDDAVTISEIGDNSGSLLTAFEAANGGSATIPYGGR